MTTRTRYFFIGSAAVLLAGLGSGLVAYYNGSLPVWAGRASNRDLVYVPAAASAVGHADVRAVMSSQFRERLRQMLPTGEEAAKLQAELGVDLERDVDSVTAAFLSGGAPFGGAMVVVRGRFNDIQIEGLAREHGATVEEYRGTRLLLMPSDRPADRQTETVAQTPATGGVAFLEPGVLALGEAHALRAAIDTKAGGEDIRGNAELMAAINELSGSGNTAWFVGRFDTMTGQMGLPEAVRAHMPPVQLFAVSAHVNGGVRGALRADARDDQAADQLRDVVRGALAAGRLVAGQNPQVDAMLNSLQLTGTGRTVTVNFTVPAEMLDVLNGLAANRPLGNPSVIRR